MIEVGTEVDTPMGVGVVINIVTNNKWNGYVISREGVTFPDLLPASLVTRRICVGNLITHKNIDGVGLVLAVNPGGLKVVWSDKYGEVEELTVSPNDVTVLHKGAAQ